MYGSVRSVETMVVRVEKRVNMEMVDWKKQRVLRRRRTLSISADFHTHFHFPQPCLFLVASCVLLS